MNFIVKDVYLKHFVWGIHKLEDLNTGDKHTFFLLFTAIGGGVWHTVFGAGDIETGDIGARDIRVGGLGGLPVQGGNWATTGTSDRTGFRWSTETESILEPICTVKYFGVWETTKNRPLYNWDKGGFDISSLMSTWVQGSKLLGILSKLVEIGLIDNQFEKWDFSSGYFGFSGEIQQRAVFAWLKIFLAVLKMNQKLLLLQRRLNIL